MATTSTITTSQQISLRWNNFHCTLVNNVEALWGEDKFCDVTIYCQGQEMRCHKVILSACSDAFKTTLIKNTCQHPIIILQDINPCDLKAILKFIYKGEVEIEKDQLKSVLKAAATLQITGLAGISSEEKLAEEVSPRPVAKRQRLSPTTAQSQDHTDQRIFIESSKLADQKKQGTTLETTTEIPDDTMVMDTIVVEEVSRTKEEITLTSDGEEVENVVETIDDTLEETYRMDIHLNASGRELNSSAVNRIQQAAAIPPNRTAHLDQRTPLCPRNQVEEPQSDSTPACSNKNVPFACPFCNRNYTSFGFRRRHLKAAHIFTQLLCKWCQAVQPSKEAWEKHVTTVHSLSRAETDEALGILSEAHAVFGQPHIPNVDALRDGRPTTK